MLTVTNLAAVDAAFKAATPRPIRDVILEVYPGCTIDSRGRAHAPYDGYESDVNGLTYRAGEFLPFEYDDEDNRVFGGAEKRIPEAVDLDGKRHSWDGTCAQNRAVWSELVKQSRAWDAKLSNHVGTVGQMMDFGELEITYAAGYVGTFGTTWLYVMKNTAGDIIVYKGSKRFEYSVGRFETKGYDRGDKLQLRAKIKSHGEREGVAQTIIERPKLTA